MVVECVVAGRQRGAGDDCRPAVGHEQRRPEGDVDQSRPPEEGVGRDAEDPRTDVVLEPAQADDNGLGDERDGRAGQTSAMATRSGHVSAACAIATRPTATVLAT